MKEKGKALAEAVGAFGNIINGGRGQIHALLDKCKELFGAEVCAVWVIKGGYCDLLDHIGYEARPDGSPIPLDEVREVLRYQVTPRDRWWKEPFDGITGQVASRAEEFGADSWDEVRRNPNHKGKPDRLIWDAAKRPFRSMFAVPLVIGTTTVGVLKVENKAGTHPSFDSVDKELVRKLASFFAFVVAQELGERFSDIARIYDAAEGEDNRQVATLGKSYDKHDMQAVIRGVPDQIAFALIDSDFPNITAGPFNKAIVAGMGGSALPVDVLLDVFNGDLAGRLTVSRTYQLPARHDARTLVIGSSFSGATEETLSSISDFPPGSDNVVIIASGGPLAALAEEQGYPLIRIPKEREPNGFQPRSATGYFVTYLARLLAGVGILPDPTRSFEELVAFLRREDIRSDAEDKARWIGARIPVIYTDDCHERSVARVAKIKFNENTKRAAFFNVLPEANHNEMIGFQQPLNREQFAFLYLRDPTSHPSIHLRFEVMKSVFTSEKFQHIFFSEWEMRGQTNLERIFSALMFAEWCSYSLALMHRIDPTPVNLVEEFKLKLEQRRLSIIK